MARLDVTISSHSPSDRCYVLTEQLDRTCVHAKENTFAVHIGYFNRLTEQSGGSIAISHLYKVSPEVRSYIDRYIVNNPELSI